MTIRVLCDGDGCGKPIDRGEGGWFGVDYSAPPVDPEPDEDGMVMLVGVAEFGADHEFHFCSADHALSWFMSRAFSPQSSGG